MMRVKGTGYPQMRLQKQLNLVAVQLAAKLAPPPSQGPRVSALLGSGDEGVIRRACLRQYYSSTPSRLGCSTSLLYLAGLCGGDYAAPGPVTHPSRWPSRLPCSGASPAASARLWVWFACQVRRV